MNPQRATETNQPIQDTDLLAQYGRAVFEVEFKSRERDDLFVNLKQAAAIKPCNSEPTVPTPPVSQSDTPMVRSILVEAIRACDKSRAQIAEEMSFLVGREITERMLNGFTAESKDDYRFPSELERAFCTVTGDNRLLISKVERHGLYVIDANEKDLLELGRAYAQRTNADERIELLQRRISERTA